MTELLEDLTAKVRIDTSDMDKTKEKASSFSDVFSGLLAATSVEAIGEKVIDFGKESVEAYEAAQKAQDNMANSFAHSPELIHANVSAFEDLAEHLSTVTEYSKTETEAGMAKLAMYGMNATQLKELTPLVQDYAAKTGTDMVSASEAIGKSLLGQGRALKSIGVNFVNLKDPTKNFNEVFGDLKSKVGGFAEEEGKTATGQMAILGNEFDEVKEKVGAALVPVITTLEGVMLNLFSVVGPMLGPAMDALSNGVKFLTDHMDWILPPMAAVVAGLVAFGVVNAVSTGIEMLTGAFTALTGAMAANPIGMVAIALVALGAALAEAYTHVAWFRDDVNAALKVVSKAFGDVVSFVKTIWPEITEVIMGVFNAVKTIVMASVDTIIALWKAFGTQIVAIITTYFSIVRDYITTVINVVRDVISIVLDLITGKWGAAWNGMKQLVTDIFSGIYSIVGDTLTGILKFFSDLPGKILTALGDLAGLLKEHTFDPVVSMVSAIFQGLTGLIGHVLDGIVDTVKGIIDVPIGIVNDIVKIIDGIKVTVPSWVPVIGGKGWEGLNIPTIPSLAEGGIVQATPGGTLVRAGEGGQDEAVVPLDKKGKGMGQTINIYVTQANATATDIARELGWAARTV